MAQGKLRSMVIPPPIKGWNAKDPIVSMDPMYAITLENMQPKATTLDLRNGYTIFASAMAANNATDIIRTLCTHNNSFMVAGSDTTGSGTKFYSINTSGTVADITGVAVLAEPACVTMSYRDRTYLRTLNTSDALYHWTGTGNIAATGFVGPSGGDNDTRGMTSYRNRFYLGEYVNQQIWYSGFDAVTGAMTAFDLRSIFQRSSHITILGTISRTKNYLEDSLLVVINEAGEVLIYQGEYPGSATWSIVGHYFIPTPLGPKAFANVGGDLLILTQTGVISIIAIMQEGSGFAAQSSISNNIADIFPTLPFSANGDFYNAYTIIDYPKGGYLLVNIPITTDVTSNQFIMNSQTGAWARFIGQNAFCWTVFNNGLYFGGTNGKVALADNGDADTSFVDGTVAGRRVLMRPAYNYFDNSKVVKQMTSVRPFVTQSQGLSLTMDADMDYQNTTATNTVSDSSDTSYKLYMPEMTLNGVGKAASIRIDQLYTTKRMSLQAMEVFWNEGDIR